MKELNPAIFKNIRRIQLNSTKLANSFLAGAYHSAFKGKGMEFEDVRAYVPGDEIRSIDWNVTARMNEPYVKNFREERELSVLLLVDISASARFGSLQSKQELIAEIGSLLAFSATKNNDRVGLILFSDIIEEYLPPKRGTSHILRIVRDLLAYVPARGKTDIAHALHFLGKVQKKTCICFLISDFLAPDFSHEAKLIARQHDLIAMSVNDPLENQFPQKALLNFQDLETGEQRLIEASPSEETRLEGTLKAVKALMSRVRGGYIPLLTNEPYLPAIQRFFKSRAKP